MTGTTGLRPIDSPSTDDPAPTTTAPDRRVRRPGPRAILAVVVVIVALGVAMAWFQPYKLFLDDTVDEALPAQLNELGRGGFQSLEHGTTGTAIVYRSSDGERVLRLDELDTSNGPDLRVILASAPLSGDARVWGDDYVEVARLKGNVGSQNYVLPDDVDLARYGRVVIWCDRFDVGFGVADVASAAGAGTPN